MSEIISKPILNSLFRDRFGRRVFIQRVGKMWDPALVPVCKGYGLGYKLMELAAMEPRTQVSGITIIIDNEGFGLK